MDADDGTPAGSESADALPRPVTKIRVIPLAADGSDDLEAAYEFTEADLAALPPFALWAFARYSGLAPAAKTAAQIFEEYLTTTFNYVSLGPDSLDADGWNAEPPASVTSSVHDGALPEAPSLDARDTQLQADEDVVADTQTLILLDELPLFILWPIADALGLLHGHKPPRDVVIADIRAVYGNPDAADA